ncbi:DUF6185 family protein [Streptomyces sp. NPDC058989]|uniref:DUF6185 family protein n=1 Tax=Streptomyces sp. NPDC058989 TaxID=3346686 RepID=UPI0036ABB02A
MALVWGVAQPAQTHAADRVDCPATPLTKANIDSTLVFNQRHRDFVEVRQKTIIEVPKWKWRLAHHLTLSVDSAKFRHAMYCLLHGNSKPQKGFERWHPEWQSDNSRAGKDKAKGLVAVQYESWNLINDPGEYEVGPWAVEVGRGDWLSTLRLHGALSGASWKRVKVHPGNLEISDATPVSIAHGDRSREWNGDKPDRIRVTLVPPRAPALAPSGHVAWVGYLGVVSWWVCASIVIAVSAWKFLRRPPPASDDVKVASRVLAFTAWQWAALSAALGLTLLLVLRPSPGLNSWRALVVISSGLALVLLARPWLPLGHDANDRESVLKRKVVVASSSAVALFGLLVILAPHLFGLPSNLIPKGPPPRLGIAGLVVLDLCTLWLWLTAMVAWAWRFAREGKLGASASKGASASEEEAELPPTSSGSEPRDPLRPIAAIGAALAVIAAIVVVCRVLSFELSWKRASWMSEATALFGADHRSALGRQLADFASMGPQWLYAYTWVLTGVALVALLRFSSQTGAEKTLGPNGVDLLLVTAVFAIVVASRGSTFPGSVAAVYGLWVPLNMVALYGLVKAGRRWSVLSRVDRKTEKRCLAAVLSDAAQYKRLLDEAHRCRDVLHRLRLVDHGKAEEATREKLEGELRSLHRWRPTRCPHECLPDSVSVVDVALSWGPHSDWWDNGVNAARWSAIFGIIPSMVVAGYEKLYGANHGTFTLNLPTGIPDTFGKFLAQEISFAGAGLVLGTLWRVLPGERGPVRAFNLFIAWLVPIGVIAVLIPNMGGTELGLAVLNVILMLMVLTLTGMWMDTDTFSRERHYKTKRLGLLTSIYQVHGLSGQIAFLIAQLATAVTIWHHIVTTSK